MGKIAFIFPGQGAQAVGMGKEIYEQHPGARAIFDEADRILGKKISDICFNGPDDVLKDTRNAQPAILTTSVAMFKVMAEAGIKPDFVAGHSLGEYSALVAGGAVGFTDAVQLVRRRSQLMAEADPEQKGMMAAILGMERNVLQECLTEAAKDGKVEAANFNCPGQIVISGVKTGVAKTQEIIAEKGGKVIPLAVSGAFHSSLMKPAADLFKTDLDAITWSEPSVPVIANVNAAPVHQDAIAESLYQQMYSSVLWEDTLNYLHSAGVDRFVELGPGKVLSGLVKKTLKGVTIMNCEDMASLKKALEILKEV